MLVAHPAICLFKEYPHVKIIYESVEICPVCKSVLDPKHLSAAIHTVGKCSVYSYCRQCTSTFIATFECSQSSGSPITFTAGRRISVEPNRFKSVQFDENIKGLSTNFCEIYNQALSAETSNLDQIAGIGYRKALEFLVKDFAIHLFPDHADLIKKETLSQCITNRIDSPQVKSLAKLATWIGNDEAHYTRKLKHHDIESLKNLIKGTQYFISMEMLAQSASAEVSGE